MQDIEIIRQLIENIHNNLNMISKLLPANSEEVPEVKKEEVSTPEPVGGPGTAKSLSHDVLGPIPDISDPAWPQAVPYYLMVRDDDIEKQRLRAIQIEGIIGLNTTGINVLDYGCGNGFLAAQYAKTANMSYAYDINNECLHEPLFDGSTLNLKLCDKQQLKSLAGQIDFIILFDVIDHLVGNTATNLLVELKRLLSPTGKIFMRCHPWTSRTGSHAYLTANKAFIHLALTSDELLEAGITVLPNIKANKPLAIYEDMLNKAGFKTDNKKVHTNAVESYFDGDLLERMINVTWAGTVDPEKAKRIMSTTYVDYLISAI